MPTDVEVVKTSEISVLERWIQEMRARNVGDYTIKRYRAVIEPSLSFALDEGYPDPIDWDIIQVGSILDGIGRNSWKIRVMKLFLKWVGNDVLVKNRILHPKHQHLGRWLNQNDCQKLVTLAQTPLERVVIHFMMELGLRRTDLLRLRVLDIDFSCSRVNVRGKGFHDGKLRVLPFHPCSQEVIRSYLEYREYVFQVARQRSITQPEDPENLLVYERGGEVIGYKSTAIDNLIQRLASRLGFHFSSHDLRRTFGRNLYYATNRDIAVVSYALGHSDIRTTMKYLGLGYDDLQKGMVDMAKMWESQPHIAAEVVLKRRNGGPSNEPNSG